MLLCRSDEILYEMFKVRIPEVLHFIMHTHAQLQP